MTDLLEREPELASIAGALEGVAAGTGSFLVVEGPAGIGKTGLMSAARKMAQDGGIAVLSAR
ncbi:MAG TPA: ATP-binding protein, partial [Actinomycetota bacterium]|nr:ATP-binding protein [Actinomycetota bacterium]